jgi:hypothetical protein
MLRVSAESPVLILTMLLVSLAGGVNVVQMVRGGGVSLPTALRRVRRLGHFGLCGWREKM